MNKKEIIERLIFVYQVFKDLLFESITIILVIILGIIWFIIFLIDIFIASIIYFFIWILTGKKLYNYLSYKYENIFKYIP